MDASAPEVGAAAAPPTVGAWNRPGAALRRLVDRFAHGWALAGALLVSGLILVLTLVLMYGSREAWHALGWSFLVSRDWDPTNDIFGVIPALGGTLITSALALLMAVPLSLGTAIFLVRLAPRWLGTPCSFLVELLAAIPSIAYGFWGSAVLVPLMQDHLQPLLRSTLGHVPVIGLLFAGPGYGFGMLTAGMVLAIMITPIITAVIREVLLSAPRELDEGAYALGATWAQATRLVVGACTTGIFGAVVLGFARAIGETMAVTMVVGNSDSLSTSLFAPGQTMASLLANEFIEADKPIYTSALVEVALVLLVTTLITSTIARWLIMRTSRTLRAAPRPLPVQITGGPLADPAAVPPAPPAPVGASAAAAAAQAQAARPDILPRPVPGTHTVSPLRRGLDWLAKILSSTSALVCAACLFTILGYILDKGISGLNWNLFTKLPGPLGTPTGLRNCIIGSVELVAMASILGVPAGMACGIYLSEYARRARHGVVVRVLVDVLGGVPSIVVGVVAYELVVKPMHHYSGIAGAVALGLLMCPIIARTTEEMLLLVPHALREASLGAGATRAQTIARVVLPAATTGIITGIILAVARVAGETAPLLFTALGYDGDVYDPLRPFPALPLKIFAYATSPEDDWKRQAWAGMLVLIVIILILNAVLRFWTYSRRGGAR